MRLLRRQKEGREKKILKLQKRQHGTENERKDEQKRAESLSGVRGREYRQKRELLIHVKETKR